MLAGVLALAGCLPNRGAESSAHVEAPPAGSAPATEAPAEAPAATESPPRAHGEAPSEPPAETPAAPAAQTDAQRRAALLQDCGDGAQIRETAHWLIGYKADPKWVDEAAKMLERTYDHFFEQFRKAGFDPKPPGEKLICVLLDTQEDFERYRERVRDTAGQPPLAEDPAAAPGPGGRPSRVGKGSYSSRTNRIQMCDSRSLPRNPNRPADPDRTEWANVVRIAHEAAHQLSFNTGILKQRWGYPLWLGEGLACNFEFTDPAKPFGPLTDNLSPRAAGLARLLADGKILPLRRLITMSPQESHQAENSGLVYVQGWALFRFLMAERPAQFKAYVAALTDRPRPPRNGGEALAAFEGALGPVEDLEKDWQQFLKRAGKGDVESPASPAAPEPGP